MSHVLNRDTNTITVANFWESYLLNKYNFSPAYQRYSVWSDEKQSFFIDSILKNFPMPPIFLHQKIDDDTGKTKYDIIDGKQRLTSIVRFLNNEIPASDEFENSPFYDVNIAGVYFKDLDKRNLSEYKRRLWRYVIPIEYIDTSSKDVIDNIFDRLNRNGEPLTGQELRKSMYHGTTLLNLVEEMAELPYWKERLKHTDVARMEHYEFISELVFQLIENEPLHANQEELDRLYAKYAKKTLDWTHIRDTFTTTTNYLSDLGVDYTSHKVSGVSHLYGLWCVANFLIQNGISAEYIKKPLNSFYVELRDRSSCNTDVEIYKSSMSARTKDQRQRRRRMNSILSFLQIDK